jgi:hypothetical protein
MQADLSLVITGKRKHFTRKIINMETQLFQVLTWHIADVFSLDMTQFQVICLSCNVRARYKAVQRYSFLLTLFH